jgi:hypothetical protein
MGWTMVIYRHKTTVEVFTNPLRLHSKHSQRRGYEFNTDKNILCDHTHTLVLCVFPEAHQGIISNSGDLRLCALKNGSSDIKLRNSSECNELRLVRKYQGHYEDSKLEVQEVSLHLF